LAKDHDLLTDYFTLPLTPMVFLGGVFFPLARTHKRFTK
jgi:hypothetical protein